MIVGDWGYTDATLPEALLHATKVLAAWYTVRPRSVLGNVAITPEGMAIDYSSLPSEVGAFVNEYRIGAQVVSV